MPRSDHRWTGIPPLLMLLLGLSSGLCGQPIQGVCFTGPDRPVGDTALAPLVELGADQVCFMPYAFSRAEGDDHRVQQADWQWWGEREEGLEQLVHMAHAQGLRVMMKPHLWLGHGQFTGHYDPGSEAGWRSFEESYADYVVHYARLSRQWGVDLFCLGTELDHFVQSRPAFWQRLIDRVSDAFQGPLTYAANWDEVERVPFWGRMSFIGVDGYFPLCPAPNPSASELDEAWTPHLDRLEALSARLRRPVLFTEIGYCCTATCAAEPWKEDPRAPKDEAAQHAAWSAFFRNVTGRPWYAGCFVWKWHAYRPSGEADGPGNGYSPQGLPALDVLREAFDRP